MARPHCPVPTHLFLYQLCVRVVEANANGANFCDRGAPWDRGRFDDLEDALCLVLERRDERQQCLGLWLPRRVSDVPVPAADGESK